MIFYMKFYLQMYRNNETVKCPLKEILYLI
jgi:hypothetical protein